MLEKLSLLGVDLEFVSVAFMGLVALLRLPEVVRPGQLRVLWVALGTAAAAIALDLEPVTQGIFAVTGPTHLSALAGDLFGIVSAVAVMHFVLRIAAAARYLLWLLYAGACAVVTSMAAIDLAAPHHVAHSIAMTGDAVPGTGYWLVAVLVQLASDAPSVLLCWRYGRRAENPLLRLTLRLFGLGGGCFVLLWIAAIGYLVARPTWLPAFFGMLIGCGELFLAAAASVPLLHTVWNWLVDLRSYWLLWPLWRDLVEAVPHVALVAPRSRVWDLLSGVRPLSLLLYRQVIEIRDAILVLADYAPPEIVGAAREHVGASGVRAGAADAAVLACWIEVIRHGWAENPQGQCDLSVIAEHGGENLPAEVGYLLTVARIRRSALVRPFVQRAVTSATRRDGRVSIPNS